IVGTGPAPRIPPLRVNGGLEASSDRFSIRGEVEHVFKQDRISAFETPTDGFTFVNASISWKPWGAASNTSLMLSANNIFDVEARRAAGVLKDYAPLPGRATRVTARSQMWRRRILPPPSGGKDWLWRTGCIPLRHSQSFPPEGGGRIRRR